MNEGHNEEKYEYIRAEIAYGGLLTIRYKLIGLPEATLEHDEEPDDMSEIAVRGLTRKLLGTDQFEKVEVTYL